MKNKTIIKDLKVLNDKKRKAMTTNEYIQILMDIANLLDLYELVNKHSLDNYDLSTGELATIEQSDNIVYEDYSLKMKSKNKNISLKFINNLKYFKSLNFNCFDYDYFARYNNKELQDIVIEFYNNIDLEFGKIIGNFIKHNDLVIFDNDISKFEGLTINVNLFNKSYALIARDSNQSRMLNTMVHESGHLLDFSLNSYNYKNSYNNFIEVISYTFELLFFDYLHSLHLLPQKNFLEKELLQNLYLNLLKLHLFIKQPKTINKIIAEANEYNIPAEYYNMLLEYRSVSVEEIHQYPYAQSLAYLFLEQYKTDKELMVYNLKELTKNYSKRSDYENLNNYGLSLEQVKNNQPLKKALQKYS